MTKRRTVLWDDHLRLKARMIDFHGWQMPLSYATTQQEHDAVRRGWGIFDLCHMGRLRIQGPGATAFLETRVSRKLSDMAHMQVRYALILAPDGTVVDDCLVTREGADGAPESWHVVVNAANLATVRDAWQGAIEGVVVDDLSASQAMIAVQGPQAADRLAELELDGRHLRIYRACDLSAVRLSRTGYSGEDGFECFLPAAQAPDLWRRLVAAGAQPCGLGVRDILRLEAGMPLYGQELDRAHTPIEAGLDFAVARDKPFIGCEVCARQRQDGPARRLVGLRGEGRRLARPGYPVFIDGQQQIGVVTSGTLSPACDCAIAMAYVDAAHAAVDTQVSVDVRGTPVAFRIVAMPFYRRPGSKS